MPRADDSKPYDLEDRRFNFAKESRAFVKKLPRTISNIEDVKQFIRSSGSIGANYIEANESIGKKDFVMKINTCRGEAKESGYWVRLLDCNGELESARSNLLREAEELTNIFRRNRPQNRTVNLNFEFGICFGNSDFEFRNLRCSSTK
jgi:four helix bundle protein